MSSNDHTQYRAGTSIGLLPGDILTACDNELNVPTGYLGHSAIAVDERHIVEAVISYPYIQLASKESFFSPHPLCAVYRPKDPSWGTAAARCAYDYFLKSREHLQKGTVLPPFSFDLNVALDDPWTSVYCSKLVWLSYHFGVGYTLPNDFGLFTPEDLDYNLSRDPNFILVYKHPGFQFLIDS
ncbi:hypothetical protein [Paenibacillus gansuensis]|uniref:Uncharacterized protein n=1 Tax=Paenibacillus gansuensis TaxID=306542 RepID=A0ABW5PBG8_9BACL